MTYEMSQVSRSTEHAHSCNGTYLGNSSRALKEYRPVIGLVIIDPGGSLALLSKRKHQTIAVWELPQGMLAHPNQDAVQEAGMCLEWIMQGAQCITNTRAIA